jgi:hypothetical protein
VVDVAIADDAAAAAVGVVRVIVGVVVVDGVVLPRVVVVVAEGVVVDVVVDLQ